MYKLKFEYKDNFDNVTIVEKEFDELLGGQFESLLWEIKHSLLACGFGEGLIDKYIVLED